MDGVRVGLNKGMVGMGSNNARGSFDNVRVQILPPQVTYDTPPASASPRPVTRQRAAPGHRPRGWTGRRLVPAARARRPRVQLAAAPGSR
jgi:hypothetical protein